MKHYKPVDVASMLNLTTQTLMLWRKKGIGPEWVKLGQNIVRYPITNFDEWIYPTICNYIYTTDYL